MNTSYLHETKRSKGLVSLFALTALAISASTASANAPTIKPFNITVSATIPASDGLCAFDVDITAVANGTEHDYTDTNGKGIRIALNFVEQDTFSANGHQLAGDPFANVQEILLDENGNVVHDYEVGVIERVPLPHGTAFLSAGRLDFVAHGLTFAFTPDEGRSGNLDAFCAALAP